MDPKQGQFSGPEGMTEKAYDAPREVMFSMEGLVMKGCTIKGGQGILPAGCALGRITASKLYKVYSNAANDGSEVCVGVLRHSVDTGADAARNVQGNIILRGAVKTSMLSGVDAAAITDLGARSVTAFGATFF